MKRNSGRAKFEVSEATVSNVSQAGRATRPATHLSVVLDVVSERDEARLELLWVESSRARLVEVQERASELLQLLVADALRVARQDLHHSTPHIVQCASSPNFDRFTNLHFTVDFLLTSFPMDFDCFVGGIILRFW